MKCPSCGSENQQGRFCGGCGYRLQPDASAAQPNAAPAVAPALTNSASAQTRAAAISKRALAAVLAIILVAAAGVGGLLVYRHIHENETVALPSTAAVAKDNNSSQQAVTAQMMAQALQHQGFKTRVSKQYSGKPAGRFLGYANVKSGQHVRRNTPIVIKASKGPGVPQGTVGSKASTVVNTLASMHVPVTYKAVTIDASGKSTKKAGTVLATYPKDGDAVKNKSKGIVVAVAQDGDGIPVDYYGKNPDTVKKSLESKGFTVELRAKYSTKDHVGKVVATNPALGSATTAGQSVTVYYGVNASATHDLFTVNMDGSANSMGYDGSSSGIEATIGTYCHKGSDTGCITIGDQTIQGCTGDSCTKVASSQAPHQPLLSCGWYQAICAYDPAATSYDGSSYLMMGDTGTLDITTVRQLAVGYCGTGKSWNWDFDAEAEDCTAPGGNGYQMDDVWYVYVPVGGDIAAVERAGYFDTAAMKKAKSQAKPDADIPYIVARDPSLYKTRRAAFSDLPSDSDTAPVNPFVSYLGQKHRLAVKPAPSDATAYYLVENPLDSRILDTFTTIDVKTIKQGDTKESSKPGSSAKANASPSSTSKSDSGNATSPSAKPNATSTAKGNYTPAQVTAAINRGDFSLIAGKYCQTKSETPDYCMTIDSAGRMQDSGISRLRDVEQLTASARDEGMGGVWVQAPESYLGCIRDDGTVDHVNTDCISAHMVMPYEFDYYPDPLNANWDALQASEKPQDNTPFLILATVTMTPSPQDQDFLDYVFYKVS